LSQGKKPAMRSINSYALVLIVVVSLFACSKDKDLRSGSCQQLKNAMINDDKQQAIDAIEDYIASMPSKQYTQQNIENLLQAIEGSQSCSLQAQLLCFDCIHTLPSQTEIRIMTNSLSPVEKTIDLSYDALNTITVVNMHD
jgi:hypothetical protein